MNLTQVLKTNRLALTSGVLLSVLPVIFHFLPFLVPKLSSSLDLTEIEWEKCELKKNQSFLNCRWSSTRLPKLWGKQEAAKTLVLSAAFEIPEFCRSEKSLCSLVVAEVFDSVDIYLNNSLIGRHGDMHTTGNPFPISVPLPNSLFKKGPNKLRLHITTSGHFPTGLSRRPITILNTVPALVLFETLTLEKTVLPFMVGMSVLVFAFLSAALRSISVFNTQLIHRYSVFCFASFFKLMSLTRLPRQFIALPTAYNLHSILHLLLSYTFFKLSSEIVSYRGRVNQALTLSHGFIAFLTVASFLFTFSDELFFVVFLLVCIQALIVYVYSFFIHLKARKTLFFGIHILIILSLTIFGTFTDLLSILGWPFNVFYARFLPLLLAITFGMEIFRHHFELAKHQATQAELGSVASTVAHDLKSPLAALSTLEKSTSFSEDEKTIFLIAKERLNAVSKDLLSKYKATINDSQTNKEKPLKDCLNELQKEKKAIIGKRNIRLEFDVETLVKEPQLPISKSGLLQTISNLIDNSIDAIPITKEGLITLKVQNSHKYLRVYVIDNGCGISKERLTKIGTPGYTFGKTNGTGLGIANAIRDLTKINGDVKFESQEGKGTSVELTIPNK